MSEPLNSRHASNAAAATTRGRESFGNIQVTLFLVLWLPQHEEESHLETSKFHLIPLHDVIKYPYDDDSYPTSTYIALYTTVFYSYLPYGTFTPNPRGIRITADSEVKVVGEIRPKIPTRESLDDRLYE